MRYLGQCRCFALPPVINFHRVYIFYAAIVVYVTLANVQLLVDNFRMTRNDFDEKVGILDCTPTEVSADIGFTWVPIRTILLNCVLIAALLTCLKSISQFSRGRNSIIIVNKCDMYCRK